MVVIVVMVVVVTTARNREVKPAHETMVEALWVDPWLLLDTNCRCV